MTGELSQKEIYAILEHIPFEMSFIGKDDCVKYFNKEGKRIFVRKGSIGKHVESCHPKKSIEMVRTIVDSFKTGESDHAKFWFHVNPNTFVFVRYFAIRDKDGHYLGTLEVSEDITHIRKLQGEKKSLRSIEFD